MFNPIKPDLNNNPFLKKQKHYEQNTTNFITSSVETLAMFQTILTNIFALRFYADNGGNMD